jgi:hypothetical protein
MILSTRVRVTAAKLAEFQALVETEILPIYKKANVNMTVSARGLGANPGDITVSVGINKYAEMDGGSLLTRMARTIRDPARAGGAGARGQRLRQQRHRAEMLAERGHSQAPPDEHLRQDRRVESSRAGAPCDSSSSCRESLDAFGCSSVRTCC